MQVDLNQQAPLQHQTPEGQRALSDSQPANHPASLQEQAQSTPADNIPSPMQIDNPQQAPHPLPLHPASTNHDPHPAAQQQALPQAAPLQMIPVPSGLQEVITANVARCDRQLLGRQEQVLVSLLQQRVGEEVRLVQGTEDVDHPADALVQKVSKLGGICCFLQQHDVGWVMLALPAS